MVEGKTKKTSEKIKNNIILELNKGPKTISEISDKINSNWLTTEKFLKELAENKKVKEIVSTDKKKIYQIITGDTYFNIPISKVEREKFITLFSLIKKAYSKENIVPTKTHFSKTAVYVIKNSEELSELPTIWYLYGAIPLMVADPSQEYQEEINFEKKDNINNLITTHIKDNYNKSSRQLQKDQHFEYQEELYILSDKIFTEVNRKDWNDKKILNLLNQFYIACPIDNEFPKVFDFMERFNSTIRKLTHFTKLQKSRKEILLTFNSLWKYIATYKVYKSIEELNRFENTKVILEFSIGNLLDARKICFQESFSELYSIYWDNLNEDVKFECSKNVLKIKEIMQDWTGED